jgi:hypothetical protein
VDDFRFWLDMSATQQAELMSGSPSDVNFSNVVLLLHCEGANNGTSFVDSSSYARTMTAAGGAVTSTAYAAFGSSSALCNTTSARVYAASASELSPVSADFTVEFTINLIATNTFGRSVLTKVDSGTSGFAYEFSFGGGNSSTLNFSCSNGSSQVVSMSTSSLGTGTGKKIAVSRNGSAWGLFVDGTRVATNSYAGALASGTGVWQIGTSSGNSDLACNNYFDEIRVTQGVGRYPGASYSVSTSAFPDH